METKLVKCPYCTISIHESWTVTTVYVDTEKNGKMGTNWRIQYMVCPECKKSILRFGRADVGQNYITEPKVWQQFFPSGSSRPPVSETKAECRAIPDYMSGFQTRSIRLGVESFTQSTVKKRQRVVSVNEQDLRDAVFYCLYRFRELFFVLGLGKHLH
jgi:hypothetical protein